MRLTSIKIKLAVQIQPVTAGHIRTANEPGHGRDDGSPGAMLAVRAISFVLS